MPGTDISYKAILKFQMPLKVLHPLPTIGLELYQLGGTNEGIKRKYQCMADVLFIFCGFNSFAFVE